MFRPLLLFAPGAGAPSSSIWMEDWRQRLASLGEVATFDYPYMRSGRRTPDRLPVLIRAHREAMAEARSRNSGPIVLIGKSMGARIGCHVALEEAVQAVVCLGYPLKAARSGAIRDEVLLRLQTRILFIQGTRDALCPLDLLAQVRARMTAPNDLFLVEGGNHSLEVPRQQLNALGETQGDVNRRILDGIAQFLEPALA